MQEYIQLRDYQKHYQLFWHQYFGILKFNDNVVVLFLNVEFLIAKNSIPKNCLFQYHRVY